MIIALIVAGYVASGVLAYGMCYRDCQREFWNIGKGAGRGMSFICFLSGYAGLIAAFMAAKRPYGLQYRYRKPKT